MKLIFLLGPILIVLGLLLWNPITSNQDPSGFDIIVSGMMVGTGIAASLISLAFLY